MINFIRRLLGLESKEQPIAPRRNYHFTGRGQLQYKASGQVKKKETDRPMEINGRIVMR